MNHLETASPSSTRDRDVGKTILFEPAMNFRPYTDPLEWTVCSLTDLAYQVNDNLAKIISIKEEKVEVAWLLR
jgi:hypothetical protein